MLEEVEKALRVTFQNKKLLKTALTHSSYRLAYKYEDFEDNERLEFIGDALLNFCISLILYEKFPRDKEGDLTKKRAFLVCKERLIEIAKKLNLQDYLFLGKREQNLELESKLNIAGRTLEALLGAIFLDQGLEKTLEIVRYLFSPYFKYLKRDRVDDFKTKLQEYLQKERDLVPYYEILKISGPAHKPEIEVAVKIGEEILAKAKGPSRKRAENLAAKKALMRLKKQEPSE